MTRWLELPAALLGEEGMIRVLAAADADADQVRAAIVAGRYGRPFLVDDGRSRRLYFDLRLLQSAMSLKVPWRLELEYTRLMTAFLLFVPSPRELIFLGLGGGSLVRFCRRQLPRAELTAVEVDADVIALADQFGLVAGDGLTIVQADAADYLPLAEGDTDVVLLDAFDGAGIPTGLMNAAFYRAARRRLRRRGLLVANLAGDEDSWWRHLELIQEAFADRVILVRVGSGDNHIAYAFADPEFVPAWATLEKSAKELQRRHGLDYPDFLRRLKRAAAF